MRKKRRQDKWAYVERDAKIVELTLKGLSLMEIAQRMGLSRNTIWRRLKSARFQGLLDEARKEVFRHTGYAAVAGFQEAIAYLRKVIAGEAEADPIRVKAAHSLLTHSAFQSLALEDVRREIEKLREALENKELPSGQEQHGYSIVAQIGEDREASPAAGELVVEGTSGS